MWSLLKEVDGALKHPSLYGPEVERVRQRTAPYIMFIIHIGQFIGAAVLFLIGLAVIIFSVGPGVPWYSVLFIIGTLAWGRIGFACASWQWHAIRTGEGRPPRRPQVMA